MLKMMWIATLCALVYLIYMLVDVGNVYPKQFHFGYIDKGYECYESIFNPHKVFQDWTLIHSELFTNSFIVVVGNPKINWTLDNYDIDQPVPNGQLASSVMFVFQPRVDQFWALYMYGYKDKDGFINIYIWDSDADCYKKVTSTI